jgi:2-polyprenyl-3-methyl-5-hydroxy-6-metoxy-1,4-benzoquinol methylase
MVGMFLCWCGNSDLTVFSPEYLKCMVCETLVSKLPPPAEKVVDDDHDFYGRDYWFVHQEKDLGFPNVIGRARADLSERCLHWLRSILRYKLPPAHLLELGCAHGGFVALLRWAGYDAMGLEMSPWIVNFARRTFDVPMLLGPVEVQQIEAGTLDIIALMDVLEHLPNPVGTMRHCLGLLRTQGALVIQTPRYPEGKTYAEMVAQGDPFLEQLKANEHLYLFSAQSICEFFRRLGAEYLEFEPAIFSHYDMFLIASRSPLQNHSTEEIAQSLILSPEGRMVQVLLDLELQLKNMHEKWGEAEADRAACRDQITNLTLQLQESEADRAARLEVIHRFGHKIDELKGQVNDLNGQVNVLNEQIGEWEKNFFFRVLRKFHLLSRRERKRFPAQTPEKS